MLNERDDDIIGLMKESDTLFQALVARREAVHNLLVSTSTAVDRAERPGPAEP